MQYTDAITKLYEKKDTYAAEDRWHFELPLVFRLRKPLRSKRRWLVNARILTNKSEQCATIGQTSIINLFLPQARTAVSGTIERIVSARQYIPTIEYRIYGIPIWTPVESSKSLALILG